MNKRKMEYGWCMNEDYVGGAACFDRFQIDICHDK